MKSFRLPILVAALTLAGAAHADLLGVHEIRITNAKQTYIQIAEVIANDAHTGANDSVGGTATLNGEYSGDPAIDGPLHSIDGNISTNYYDYGTFHSAGAGANDYLDILLPGSFDLTSLTLYARDDCCSDRNVFNIDLLNINGALLQSLAGIDLSNKSEFANTVTLAGGTVPEPSGVALLALGLFGLVAARSKAVRARLFQRG